MKIVYKKIFYAMKLFTFCCGAFLLGLGVAYFYKSEFGSDALSSFVQGLNCQIAISQGIWNAIIAYVMVLMALLLDKKQVGLGTIIHPFICSYAINIGISLISSPNSKIIAIKYLLLGIFLIALSIAVTVKLNCGKSPYDAVIFAFMKRFNLKYNVIRWVMDGSMLITGVLLGGTFGVGTILILLVLGNLVMIFMKLIDDFINKAAID
ncbi:MAG: hypothetical protein LIR50_15805 [Bacillota bacterium]|nr:hypothetical protein [Bacillota bacterium]